MNEIKQWTNYIIIGIISIIALIFLPMLSSTADVAMIYPTTTMGWVIWTVTKLIIAIINMMIFHCFILQGKDLAKKTDAYKLAEELLRKLNPKIKRKLISPEEWTKKEYRTRAAWVFVMSLLGVFSLTQAILSYDWVSFLTYFFVITFGVVFGILEQRKTFEKWSDGYLEYAYWVVEELKAKEEMEKIKEEELQEPKQLTINMEEIYDSK